MSVARRQLFLDATSGQRHDKIGMLITRSGTWGFCSLNCRCRPGFCFFGGSMGSRGTCDEGRRSQKSCWKSWKSGDWSGWNAGGTTGQTSVESGSTRLCAGRYGLESREEAQNSFSRLVSCKINPSVWRTRKRESLRGAQPITVQSVGYMRISHTPTERVPSRSVSSNLVPFTPDTSI